MWSMLGVNGKKKQFKNSFENPFCSSRKVLVFSDTPHLMKTVRNRLFTKKSLKIHPVKPDIKWSFYENVFKHDSKMLVKVCPKITKHHFDLNNLAKMKVKYATQIFSKSMADGITFYKNKKFDGFDECIGCVSTWRTFGSRKKKFN
uniref:Transposable element P transposase n=2 Tax=Schizaphis graminum TaxID=13262 RepID=A0A2S2NLY2_SCHGA